MAVKRNNPGNVELGSGKWQGLTPTQSHRFATFTDVTYGIRAIAVTLITYQDKYKIRTISAAIARYAPPSDNNHTRKYIENVCIWTGFRPSEELNFHSWQHLRPVVLAIMRQESGVDLGAVRLEITPAQVDKGLVMAGVTPPIEAERPSRTILGAKIAAAATIAAPAAPSILDMAATAAPIVEHVAPLAGVLQTMAGAAPYALAVLAFAGIAYIVWARIDDRRRGLR